jgi:hypothetical protein
MSHEKENRFYVDRAFGGGGDYRGVDCFVNAGPESSKRDCEKYPVRLSPWADWQGSFLLWFRV